MGFLKISRIFQGSQGVPAELKYVLGSPKELTGMSQECLRGSQGCVRVFQKASGGLKGASGMFQGCFRDVSLRLVPGLPDLRGDSVAFQREPEGAGAFKRIPGGFKRSQGHFKESRGVLEAF